MLLLEWQMQESAREQTADRGLAPAHTLWVLLEKNPGPDVNLGVTQLGIYLIFLCPIAR